MKVWNIEPDKVFFERQRSELSLLIEQPSAEKMRPCPDCSVQCACSGSSVCTCGCSSECAYCPMAMSSEPERYPIESKIVPLVYALFTSRLCVPCWSCEGHPASNVNGEEKYPAVWFYSRSLMYPRLISEYLDDMLFKKKIAHPWRIRVLSWAQGLDTRFCIEPKVGSGQDARLSDLQAEIPVIAESLAADLKSRAATYLKCGIA